MRVMLQVCLAIPRFVTALTVGIVAEGQRFCYQGFNVILLECIVDQVEHALRMNRPLEEFTVCSIKQAGVILSIDSQLCADCLVALSRKVLHAEAIP
jgi:hypothetical protein